MPFTACEAFKEKPLPALEEADFEKAGHEPFWTFVSVVSDSLNPKP